MKFFILLTFLFQTAFAQLKTVEFYLSDIKNAEPIPFALCYLKNSHLSATSFENGYVVFQLSEKYMKDTLVIKHLSYETLHVLIAPNIDTIFLTRKENIINEVLINSLTAEQIIVKAINSIEKNYNQKTYYESGNYTQTHLENSKYVRYIEAKCLIENLSKATQNQREKFYVRDLRRSFNYEKNGEQHGDHLFDLMQENGVRYLSNQFLNPKNLNQFNWEIENTTATLFFIQFTNKQKTDQFTTQGFVTINKADWAILEYKIHYTPTQHYHTKSNWKLKSDFVHFIYKKESEYYALNSATKKYVHEVYHPVTFTNPSLIEERFSWVKTDETFTIEPKNFKFHSNLYSLNYIYKAENWLNNSIDNTIIEDLSHNVALEKQF